MNRVVDVGLAVFACLMVIPAATSAQGTGASGFVGAVRDTTGAVLPGVTVEAASPALIEKLRSVVTDEQGQYRIIDLRPGVYTVTFSLPGFSTLKRQGIELTANFTASVNAELSVGTVEETVTVSGQAPVVDVQNVAQQKTISRDLLDSVPTNRAMLGFAALTSAIIIPPSAQDVGGSKGELSVRMAVHGSKQGDQKLLWDGMRFNHLQGDGTGRSFYTNIASVQEVVVALGAGGGLAEQSVGGVLVNVIPKDGGNKFTGYFYTTVTGDKLQSDNLTPDLEARGLPSPNGIQKIYDVNAAVGGPIKRDKLWFFSAHRKWGKTDRIAGLYHDANLDDWIFTPDLSRPADAIEANKSHNLRLTWQAAPKHKVGLFYDWQHDIDRQRTLITSPGAGAWETATALDRQPISLSVLSWTYPATNQFLFEAAGAVMQQVYTDRYQDGVSRDAISVLEQSKAFRYRAPTSYGGPHSNSQTNQRFSMSYVTGSHQFKTGIFLMMGRARNIQDRGGAQALSYTFSNGRPIQLTQYVKPVRTVEKLMPEFGLFAQDQWKIKRMTLNLGLRFESFHSYVPASQQPAGLYTDARSFDKVDCVPCWQDVSPRLGASYDLFGDGKTALKASFGEFTRAQTVGIASANNPVNTTVNNVNRSWTDTNGNFVPDCDLRNTEANGECGRMSNVNFGKPNVTTRYDPAVLNGWGRNMVNWQASAVIERELRPGVAVSAGYFRTWYGNFLVTDNLAVTPQDYSPYCITAPVDARLPGGGGYPVCGLYDIAPAKFGQVNNLVTFASNYGKETEIYNGADFNFSVRLPRGAQVAGGLNIGNSISGSGGLGGTTSATNRCFVVDSPQQLYQCDIRPPYGKQFKVAGSYPLPWDVQASAVFQTLPGPPIAATYNATTAEIAPSLGRNLAGSARTAPIELIVPFSEFEGRINQLDIRLARNFRVGQGRILGMFDLYNALNASPVLSQNRTYGPNWLRPDEILAGRLMKFGIQLEF